MALGGYLVVLAFLTLMPLPLDYPVSNNLTLFHTIAREDTRQFLGNLMLLVPLAVLLPAIHPWFTPLRVTATAFATSVAIEYLQATTVSARAGDIDDVLLNTLGVAIATVGVGVVRVAAH
ncbi:MAG: VanZ family protein [Mycobacteriales bacterium]